MTKKLIILYNFDQYISTRKVEAQRQLARIKIKPAIQLLSKVEKGSQLFLLSIKANTIHFLNSINISYLSFISLICLLLK